MLAQGVGPHSRTQVKLFVILGVIVVFWVRRASLILSSSPLLIWLASRFFSFIIGVSASSWSPCRLSFSLHLSHQCLHPGFMFSDLTISHFLGLLVLLVLLQLLFHEINAYLMDFQFPLMCSFTRTISLSNINSWWMHCSSVPCTALWSWDVTASCRACLPCVPANRAATWAANCSSTLCDSRSRSCT